MLKFYYATISANSQRVWITLLEKQIPFEPIIVNLDGEQFQSEFTAINPLQQVPAIVDDGLRIFESLAILDYLEAKYPVPELMPKELDKLAIARMISIISLTELQPAAITLSKQLIGVEIDPTSVEKARQRANAILQFFEDTIAGADSKLFGDRPYFTGNTFTIADIVAGTLVPSVAMFGISLDSYPGLNAWIERLSQRESFRQTAPTPEGVQAALPTIKKILETR
ncbi:glutathione S-transferase family protein [Chamaesiphon minutus]|uniref:Glutathione S-transferase n=1 Tax=Chamaesiphon minutus (strain ATCC 27169 / PCC 6605) TaxID=1173020 RepID=K9UGB1_CHAP6|nr:glutathione S-transferase family protein [Chamaesiphon minutus]AFY93244.1 glutathione S-transferase [Chamaesiphon minutus PCC 6605]